MKLPYDIRSLLACGAFFAVGGAWLTLAAGVRTLPLCTGSNAAFAAVDPMPRHHPFPSTTTTTTFEAFERPSDPTNCVEPSALGRQEGTVEAEDHRGEDDRAEEDRAEDDRAEDHRAENDRAAREIDEAHGATTLVAMDRAGAPR